MTDKSIGSLREPPGLSPQDAQRISTEHVTLASAAQLHLDRSHPIDRVGSDPIERHAGGNRPRDHVCSDLGFGDEVKAVGNMSGLPSDRVVDPFLGEIQLAVDEGAALIRHVGRKHADLAAGDLAGRSGVLTSNPTRVLALLEKASLVEDE